MKILLLDIENSPHTVFEYDLWGRSHYVPPSAFKQAGDILCFSAKWLGSSKVMFYSVHHHGKQEMIEQAWRLLDEADAVVHYNGKAHDIPHLNREFLLAALGPPSPYRHIDLFTVVKRNFKFPYRSLDYVSKALGTAVIIVGNTSQAIACKNRVPFTDFSWSRISPIGIGLS